MNTKKFLTASLLAVFAVGTARADIASTEYVEQYVESNTIKALHVDENTGEVSVPQGQEDKLLKAGDVIQLADSYAQAAVNNKADKEKPSDKDGEIATVDKDGQYVRSGKMLTDVTDAIDDLKEKVGDDTVAKQIADAVNNNDGVIKTAIDAAKTAAATDAKSKADTAETNAKSYTNTQLADYKTTVSYNADTKVTGGTYVKADNTVANNLNALDTQIATLNGGENDAGSVANKIKAAINTDNGAIKLAIDGAIEDANTYTDDQIKALDSSIGTGYGILRTVTVTDGKITDSTRSEVATADIASKAVTAEKLAAGVIPDDCKGVVPNNEPGAGKPKCMMMVNAKADGGLEYKWEKIAYTYNAPAN